MAVRVAGFYRLNEIILSWKCVTDAKVLHRAAVETLTGCNVPKISIRRALRFKNCKRWCGGFWGATDCSGT
jgi:hypothetical protein